MLDIKEVAEKTYNFVAPVPNIQRILSTYIIKDKKNVLVDPGPASAIPFVLEAASKLGMKDVAYIIPTHIHLDHAGAAGKLTELFPQAQVVLHPLAVRHAIDPSRLIQSTKMAFGDDFETNWGAILPVSEGRIIVPKDGEKIPIGGRGIRIIYAPGHAPHHIAIFDEKTGGLFCGEALGVPRRGAEFFPMPAIVPPSFDAEEYLETMAKLAALTPKILFYGHDGVGREPEKLITKAQENLRVFGDIILKSLKADESPKETGRRIQEYILTSSGVSADASDRTMTVNAYAIYFKKKGLV